ncbi:MAG: hypothetical protein WBM98_18085 [Maribacter sp.]|uniref:hypothetical protein n=1 Tax=Maribacter sp. TaxID=1897614 RepID=UPI003C73EE96
MKGFIYPCILLCSAFLFSQEGNYGFVESYRPFGDYLVDKDEKTIEGSPYLYETWDNASKVYFNEKAYTFNTFNFNAYAGQFEAKLSADSVFIVNPSGVDKVVLGNKVFKRYVDPEIQRNTYFEEILKAKDLLLLRKYYTSIKKAEVNPLTKTPMGLPMLKLEEDFYILKGESTQLEKINFKKSSVLDLIDKKVVKKVQSYVKENGLKYNNLEDVTSILTYYNTLGS